MPNPYENYHKGNVDFMDSRTRENLMRAFAGESQARNRYTFAASAARKEKLEAVARVFEFTADQERAHAKVFYDLLLPSAGQNIAIDGNYPIDLSDKTLDLLKAARHNEYEEFEHDYAAFAEIAHREGFDLIGGQFQLIAPRRPLRAAGRAAGEGHPVRGGQPPGGVDVPQLRGDHHRLPGPPGLPRLPPRAGVLCPAGHGPLHGGQINKAPCPIGPGALIYACFYCLDSL